MADDPVGHKSAVGAAGLEEVIAVHLRVSGERRVAEGHEIVEIHRAVFAADVHERAAPVAARGVAENDEVAPARPVLHFMVKHRAVHGFRAAVDIENDGVFFARLKVHRLQNEAVHLVVFRREGERFRPGDIFSAQRGVVEVRNARSGLVVKLLRAHIPERAEKHFPAAAVEAVNGAAALRDRGDDAVFELIKAGAVEARGDKVQHVAVHLHRASAAVADIAADGRADGLAVDGAGRNGERFVVERIEINIGVHAVLSVCGEQKQEGSPESVCSDIEIGAALGNGFLPAGGELHAVQIRAAEVRRAGDGDIEQAVVNRFPVLRELHVGYGEAGRGQAGEGLLLRIVVEKALVRAARVRPAVPPPRKLRDDLVILVFLPLGKVRLDELFVTRIQIFKAGER